MITLPRMAALHMFREYEEARGERWMCVCVCAEICVPHAMSGGGSECEFFRKFPWHH